MAIAPVILHGAEDEMLDDQVTEHYTGLDEVTQDWISTSASLFSTGDSMPDHPNVEIRTIQKRREAGDFRYSISGVGLIGTKGSRLEDGYPKVTENLEGLDEASVSYMTTNENLIEKGDALSGYSNMYAVSVTRELLYATYYRVQARYLGLIGTKPYKRTLSVNGQTVDLESVTVGYPGGWSEASAGRISIPKIVVSDFVVIDGDPPTNGIPGNDTPPDPPSIRSLTWSGPVTKVWPNGWTLAAIEGDYIAGTSIWAGRLVYEYVWATMPASGS